MPRQSGLQSRLLLGNPLDGWIYRIDSPPHIAVDGANLCGGRGNAAADISAIPPGRYCVDCATIAAALIEQSQQAIDTPVSYS